MFVPGSPTGSFSVSQLLFVKESMGWARGREESKIEKEMEIRRRETLKGGPVTSPPTKQKTAYEIDTCDWSSDVCSSDLSPHPLQHLLLVDFWIAAILTGV